MSAPVTSPMAVIAPRRSGVSRSVGRPSVSPVRTVLRLWSAVVRSAWWRALLTTRSVDLSSGSAKALISAARSSSNPSPRWADMVRIEGASSEGKCAVSSDERSVSMACVV